MSMDRCTRCNRYVDTDFDLDCYHDESIDCVCESCWEDEQDADEAQFSRLEKAASHDHPNE
jgi:hypothetical protein